MKQLPNIAAMAGVLSITAGMYGLSGPYVAAIVLGVFLLAWSVLRALDNGAPDSEEPTS